MIRNIFQESKEIGIQQFALEDVHATHMGGSTSNFEFGRALEAIIQCLTDHYIPFMQVQPKAWQKVAWEGVTPVTVPTGRRNKKGEVVYKVDTKATSLIACQRLFPNEDLRDPNRKTGRGTKAHDGIVDALLMSYYLFKSFKN